MRDFFRETVFLWMRPFEPALSNFDISFIPSFLESSFLEFKATMNFLERFFNSVSNLRFLSRFFLSWRILLKADFSIGNFHSPFYMAEFNPP